MNAKANKQTKTFESLVGALIERDTPETKAAAKVLTVHAVEYMLNAKIDVNALIKKIKTTDKGSADFIAQKAVRRALLLVQGVASGIVATVPAEVSLVLAGFAKDAGKSEPNLFAQGVLSRFIANDDLGELLTRKGVKLTERGTKAASTATAQASSVKSALRGLGIGAGVKHGRQYGDISFEHPLTRDFIALLAK